MKLSQPTLFLVNKDIGQRIPLLYEDAAPVVFIPRHPILSWVLQYCIQSRLRVLNKFGYWIYFKWTEINYDNK